MAIIGTFKATANGFTGTLETLAYKATLAIKAVEKVSEKAADYRVFKGASEVGAAWSRTSEAGKPYIFVTLTDHFTGATLPCRLHPAESGFVLVTTDK